MDEQKSCIIMRKRALNSDTRTTTCEIKVLGPEEKKKKEKTRERERGERKPVQRQKKYCELKF